MTPLEQARAASGAASLLRRAGGAARTRALERMAERLRVAVPAVLEANALDVAQARAAGLTAAKLDRLSLSPARIEEMASGVAAVAALPDPVGRVADERTGPTGIRARRVRVPLGVILMIFEARPNVTAEAAAICLRSGNAVLLRGGHEAARSNRCIGEVLRRALAEASLPPDVLQMVEGGHDAVDELLGCEREIQLVIPRGGEGLVRAVAGRSRIPVIMHYKGNCHVYVDARADEEMALAIVLNAKAQRPATCNAAEKLLVHADAAASFLPRAVEALRAAGVRLLGDDRARALVPSLEPVRPGDWEEEYLDLVMAVKVVQSLDEAIAHVNGHGSAHTDAIVTADEVAAHRFLDEVDSASVLWNCSTRLADGGQYGLGAEIGISTGRLHARGPMGAEELTCLKWVVVGEGQLRV